MSDVRPESGSTEARCHPLQVVSESVGQVPHHLKVVAPVVTALLWLGVGVVALGMAFGAFWPDDLRGGGGAARALAAGKFVATVLPVHAAVGLLAWGLLAAALRRFAVAGASVALAAGLLAWAMPLLGPAVPQATGPTLRVMTANLRFDHADPAGILAAVDLHQPDLLLTQEWAPLHEHPLGTALAERFPHRIKTFGARSAVDGVAAFGRHPMVEIELETNAGEAELPPWLKTKAQRLRVDVDGRAVEVFNVHPSSPQSVRAIESNRVANAGLAALAGAVAESVGPVIVAGDFNAPPRSSSARAYAAAGLLDAHAAVGAGFGHTWPAGKLPRFVPGVRIDAVWSGGGLVPVACEVAADTGSDHRPVVADLRFARSAFGG